MGTRKRLHAEDIKSRIRKRFGSLTAFEQMRGLPRGSTVEVLRGRTARNTAAEALAEALGVSIVSIKQPRKPVRAHKKADKKSIIMDSHVLEGAN